MKGLLHGWLPHLKASSKHFCTDWWGRLQTFGGCWPGSWLRKLVAALIWFGRDKEMWETALCVHMSGIGISTSGMVHSRSLKWGILLLKFVFSRIQLWAGIPFQSTDLGPSQALGYWLAPNWCSCYCNWSPATHKGDADTILSSWLCGHVGSESGWKISFFLQLSPIMPPFKLANQSIKKHIYSFNLCLLFFRYLVGWIQTCYQWHSQS